MNCQRNFHRKKSILWRIRSADLPGQFAVTCLKDFVNVNTQNHLLRNYPMLRGSRWNPNLARFFFSMCIYEYRRSFRTLRYLRSNNREIGQYVFANWKMVLLIPLVPKSLSLSLPQNSCLKCLIYPLTADMVPAFFLMYRLECFEKGAVMNVFRIMEILRLYKISSW